MAVVACDGVRPDGTFGLAAFTGHCPTCSFLGPRRGSWFSARQDLDRHTATFVHQLAKGQRVQSP